MRASTPFKVIEVSTNRNPVCDFLLVINSNWHPISYRFGVIAACSNVAPTRSLWLKISGTRGCLPPIIFARIVRPMNALQLCPWQFSHSCYGWGATSENRAKIDDFAPMRSLWSKISGTRGWGGQYIVGSTALMFACDELTASLWRVDCVTSRPGDELTVWRVDRVTSWPCDELTGSLQILHTLRFWALFGGLGTTYDVHLGFIEKRVVDFILVLIELFP